MKKYLLFLFLMSVTCHAAETADPCSTLESLVSKYVDLKIERVKTKAQWETDKQFLIEEQALLERERDFLTREIKTLEATSVQDTQKLEELRSRISNWESFFIPLIPALENAEANLKDLRLLLPPPLEEKLSHKVNFSSPQGASVSVERISELLKSYQKLQEFHNQVHVFHETLSLKDTKPKEYEVLYLGISRAFYLSSDDQESGFGELIQQKWVWTEQNSLSSSIRKAINIHKNLSTAEYVSLPLSIKE